MRHRQRWGQLLKSFGLFVFGVVTAAAWQAPMAFAGTLTNEGSSATVSTVDALSNYTFHYMNENEIPTNPGAVFEAQFSREFVFGNTPPTVLVNDVAQTIDTFDKFSDTVIRIRLTTTVPAGSDIKVTFSNVINPGDPGTFDFPTITTINNIGGQLDAYDTTDSITTTLPAASFAGGTGTSGDPYQITNCTMLQGMYTDLDASYRLENDIDCSDTVNWNNGRGFNPVGYNDAKFAGNFDGDDHTIRNLTILRADNLQPRNPGDEQYVGLFGYVYGSTIKDLNVVDSKVQGHQYVGGLVGAMESGTIQNVSFNLTTIPNNTCNPGHCVWARFGQYGGGLVGYMETGTITKSKTAGPVKGSGTVIGGFVGRMNAGTIEYSTSASNIDGGQYLGGAVGEMINGTIRGVSTSGNIDANILEDFKQGRQAGGLVGAMTDGTVDQSSASGNVTVASSSAGGLIGTMTDGVVTDAFAHGQVTSGGDRAGGLIAELFGGNVYRVYAYGSAEASDSAGGLVGLVSSPGTAIVVSNSFARASVSGDSNTGAFIGSYTNTNATLSDNYFDQTYASTNECYEGGVGLSGCIAVNTTGSQSDYFTKIANAPFTQGGTLVWEADTWLIDGQSPPQLMVTPPYMVCEQASATTSTASAHCYAYPLGGWGTTTWEARYKKASDSTYMSLTLPDDNEAQITLTGLLAETEYYIEFRFTNNYGVGEWGRVIVETASGADSDGDGIPDSDENNAPNSGDANNNGTPDSQEAFVGSFLNPLTNKYVSIEIASACTLSNTGAVTEQNQAAQDSGYDYPTGLVNFTANCGTPGYTTPVKLFYFGIEKANLSLRKYNPSASAYFSLTGSYGATLSQQTIGGQPVTVAAYQLTDGSELDSDATANGTIVDPVGLAELRVGAPNTGLR